MRFLLLICEASQWNHSYNNATFVFFLKCIKIFKQSKNSSINYVQANVAKVKKKQLTRESFLNNLMIVTLRKEQT